MFDSSPQDSFPSFRGGAASKTADLYERAWTVQSLLDLLSGEVTQLRLEEQGPDGLGVEFSRVLKSGKVEYHSVKRQAPDSAGRWLPADVTRAARSGARSILSDLFGHLAEQETCRAVFVSQDAVAHLREAAERARASSSLEEFLGRLSKDQRRAFNERVAPLAATADEAWTKLRDCEFATIGHRELVRHVEQRVAALIGRVDGWETDPTPVRTLLEDFAWSRLGQTVKADDIRGKLKAHGYREHRLPSGEHALRQIRARTDAYLGRVEQALINGAAIPRAQSVEIADKLANGDQPVVLDGGAGVGKSCVMAQVVRRLDEAGAVSLAFPASDLRGAFSSTEVGQRLGLGDSPARSLALVAQGRPAVLCIDQLDALAGETERNDLGHRVLRELVSEVAQYPNLRILFGCRSFDLEEETSLKWISRGPAPVADKIEVTMLTVNDVRSALELAVIDPRELTESQTELLRTPLHLYLFIEAAQSRKLRFASIDDLFDAYWTEKSKRVSRRPLVASGGWSAAISTLSNALSERESHTAPDYELLDSHQETAAALASESVVFIQQGEVGFFHESFFDYAFARSFAAERRDLLTWLSADAQGYFRRRQVLGVLVFLRRRRADRGRYLQALKHLLADAEVRFHIKKRVLDWLRSLTDPTLEEWEIVERQAGELGGHAWGVPRNSVPWFDLLSEMERWREWLSGEDSEIDRAVDLLQTPELLEQRTSMVLAFLTEHQDDSAEWRNRLWSVAIWSDGYGSPEKREWLVELIMAEPFEHGGDFVTRGRVLSQILFAVKQEAPWFVPKVIAAWFDRQHPFLIWEAVANPDRIELGLHIDDWILNECATAAPLEFAQQMFPRLALIEQAAPLKFVGAPRGGDRLDRGLHSLVAKSMIHTAETEPDALKATVDDVIQGEHRWTHWMSIAWLNAMSANPERFADEIVQFMLGDPNRRLDLGYGWGTGGSDLFVAVSRNAVAAATAHCAEEAFRDLVEAILNFRPQRRCSDEQRAAIELALLWCLPNDRIDATIRQRIIELEARFPDAEWRGAPEHDAEDVGFGWAVSPISDEEALSISAKQWLAKMREVAETGETFRGNAFVGGVHELSQTLEAATRQDPARFASLVDQLDASDRPEYFEAVLSGLTTSKEDSPRSGSLDQAVHVLLRIRELSIEVHGMAVARAIGELADERVPEALLSWLCRLAVDDPDPETDDWLGPDGPMAPINQAINTTRGTAAEAIAKLLIADASRWDMLRDTVNQLTVDPVFAVRATAAHCLLAILDARREEALNGFRRLTEGADSIAGSHYVEHFIRRATRERYADMRSTLVQLLESTEPSAVRVGARWIVLSAILAENSAAREDERRVLTSGEHARAGAADIYAANILDQEAGQRCVECLCEMFDDESDAVRESAARCWFALTADQITEQGALLSAFAQSRAFDDSRLSVLLHRLEDATLPLPAELCAIAERVIESFGEKAASAQHMEALTGQTLATLLLSLLEQTMDPDIKRRVQDSIDRMIEGGFYGVEEELQRRLTR